MNKTQLLSTIAVTLNQAQQHFNQNLDLELGISTPGWPQGSLFGSTLFGQQCPSYQYLLWDFSLIGRGSRNVDINRKERKPLIVTFRTNRGLYLQYKNSPELNSRILKGQASPCLCFSVPHTLKMQVSEDISTWALALFLTSIEFCSKVG